MKKILKSRIFFFILGALLFGSIVGVSATILYQADEVGFTPDDPNWNVNNLEDALNDLYTSKNNTEDEYTNKEYITTGLTYPNGYVTITDGGYYTDSNGTTYVNMTIKMLKSISGSTSAGIIEGLPNVGDYFITLDSTQKYAFRVGLWSNDGRIVYYDRAGTGISANTTLVLKFKY